MRNSIILIIAAAVLFSGCHHDPGTTPVPDPDKAVLIFPLQSSACTTGTVVSATQSSITFTWNTSANTNIYEVDIKNLLTNAITVQVTTTNTLTATLLRDTPYAWWVVSRSTNTTASTQSDVWKFYNAGAGTLSHPPFPADALKPTFGQSVTAASGAVNLSWTGSDPDSDIAGYDIYFGTASTPVTVIKTSTTDMFDNGVAVTSGTTYYWKVVTKDALGNISDSGVFQFKVN